MTLDIAAEAMGSTIIAAICKGPTVNDWLTGAATTSALTHVQPMCFSCHRSQFLLRRNYTILPLGKEDLADIFGASKSFALSGILNLVVNF
jgi:hypothetical protein